MHPGGGGGILRNLMAHGCTKIITKQTCVFIVSFIQSTYLRLKKYEQIVGNDSVSNIEYIKNVKTNDLR